MQPIPNPQYFRQEPTPVLIPADEAVKMTLENREKLNAQANARRNQQLTDNYNKCLKGIEYLIGEGAFNEWMHCASMHEHDIKKLTDAGYAIYNEPKCPNPYVLWGKAKENPKEAIKFTMDLSEFH